MKEKVERQSSTTSPTTVGQASSLAATVKDLSLKVDEIKSQLGSLAAPVVASDTKHLASAIRTLAENLGSCLSSRAPVQSPLQPTVLPGATMTHVPGLSPSPRPTSSSQTAVATSTVTPKVTIAPPSSEMQPHFDSPIAIAKRKEAMIPGKGPGRSLNVREEYRPRSPIPPTPSAFKGMLIGDGDGDGDETPPMNTGPLFAQQNPSMTSTTTFTSARGGGAIDTIATDKPKRTNGRQTTLAQAIAESTTPANHTTTPVSAPLPPHSDPPLAQHVESGQPNTDTVESIPPPVSQTVEPEYVSNGSNPPKRRKTSSNTRAVKQERLSGQALGYKPTTRSEATKAKEVGIDIINMVDSQSPGRSSSSDGRKTRVRSQQGRWVKGQDSQANDHKNAALGEEERLSRGEIRPVATEHTQQSDQETYPSQPISQPGLYANDSMPDTDFGYGQALSDPSLPHFGSTSCTFDTQTQTQEPTQSTLPLLPPSSPGQKQTTSTDRVEASPSLAVAVASTSNHEHHYPQRFLTSPSKDTLPPSPRTEWPYRRYQAYGKAAHAKKLSTFGKSFGALDSDED